MMKKHFYAYLIVALTFCSIFTSCKDDEPEMGPVGGKTYGLVEYNQEADPKTSPITLDWVSTGTFPFLGAPYNLHDMLTLVQALPLIEGPDGNTYTMGEALPMVLNQISFLPDGGISAKYKDSPADAEWKTSPSNFARYEFAKDGKMRLFVNFDAIVEDAASRAGVADLVPVFLKHLSRIMNEGVTITVREVAGVTEFYIDQETFFNIMNDLRPFFEDEAFVKELTAMIAGMVPADAQMLVSVIVPGLLQSLPDIMDKTTDVHFGINTVLVK